jgi:hypothetical protein
MLNIEDKLVTQRPPLHANKQDNKPLRPGIENLDEEAI